MFDHIDDPGEWSPSDADPKANAEDYVKQQNAQILREASQREHQEARQSMGADYSSQATSPQSQTANPTPAASSFSGIANALNPLAPLPLVNGGPNPVIYGWARLGIYSIAAMATWKKARSVSYALCGAAAVSLVTSMSASAK